VLEIYAGVGGPKGLLQFLAGHQFAGSLQQDFQYLKGLTGKSKPYTFLSELSRVQVCFEWAEGNDVAGLSVKRHTEVPAGGDYHKIIN
jgi:hypothetical protein